MSKGIKLAGVSSLLRKFDQYDANIQNEIKVILEDTADKIEKGAQDRAPDRRANMEVALAQNIAKFSENEGKLWRIEVNSQALPFAAYIEFGTGQDYLKNVHPTLPVKWQRLAKTFYVNGKGTLRHTPFLYPAYVEHTPALVKELKALIKKSKL